MRQNQSIRGIISPARLSVSARLYLGSIGSVSAPMAYPRLGFISGFVAPARLGSHKSVLNGFLADFRHYSGFSLSRYTLRHYRIVEGFKAILGDCALFCYIVTRFSYCIYPVILYKTPVILVKNVIFLACERLTPLPIFFAPLFFLEPKLTIFRGVKGRKKSHPEEWLKVLETTAVQKIIGVLQIALVS